MSTKKPAPDDKPEPVFLARPFDPPPKGCRYYIAKKRKLCGKPKLRKGHYCGPCSAKVSAPVDIDLGL